MDTSKRPSDRKLRIGGWLPAPRPARAPAVVEWRGDRPRDGNQLHEQEPDALAQEWTRSEPPGTPIWRRRRAWLAALASMLLVAATTIGASRLLGGAPEPDADVAYSTSAALPAPRPPGIGTPGTSATSGSATTPGTPAASTSASAPSPGAPGGSSGPRHEGAPSGPGQPAAPAPGPPQPTTTTGPGAPATSYEAESTRNALGGGARSGNLPGASGGRIVQYVGSLRFTDVTVTASGRYSLSIVYVCGDLRTAYLRINGGASSFVTFPSSGGSTSLRSLSVPVDLRAGPNTVELTNLLGWAPGFDRIVVT